MSFLWDLIQSDSSKVDGRIVKRDLGGVEQRLDALSLATQAMWEILSKKYGVSEAELLSKIEEIDLRDGVLDGALNMPSALKCAECGHQMKKKRANCYWCGAKVQSKSPFGK